jgi:hypothetical protein
MALVVRDRVQETTTTTGTGTLTLLGAVTGYQAFSIIGNTNTTYYTISSATSSEWEVGIGTYTLSGTTLSRDTVLASSNSGSLVTLSPGTKNVFVTYPASYNLNNTSSFNLGTTSVTLNRASTTQSLTGINIDGTAGTANALNTANSYTIVNLTATGTVSASSDERLKTRWRDLQPDFIDQLAKVKHGIYDRIDQDSTQVGVGAQSLRPIMEHAVMEDENGDLSVAYGNAALVACVKLSQRVVELEAKLEQLIKDKS